MSAATKEDFDRAEAFASFGDVSWGALADLIADVRAEERERCAQKCENWAAGGSRALRSALARVTARSMAELIRGEDEP